MFFKWLLKNLKEQSSSPDIDIDSAIVFELVARAWSKHNSFSNFLATYLLRLPQFISFYRRNSI